MRILSMDIETYCETDLKKCGMYKYTQDPTFEILLFAYSFNDEPVYVIDMTKEELPDDVLMALRDNYHIKKAFNAAFERTAIAAYFSRRVNGGYELYPEQWQCTMIKSAYMGLPMNLEGAAIALNLEQKKSTIGKQLIRYFSIPCKPTETNGMRTRNLPEHDPVKWAQFMDYCEMDVIVEKAIDKKLSAIEMPETERRLWCLDQRINDRGVKVDIPLIENAIKMDEINREKLINESVLITGLDNVNSVAQLKDWLSLEMDETVTTLKADAIPKLIKDCSGIAVKRVLQIRQETSKSSIKKYTTMLNMAGNDARIRGIFQFYGANRTGRWAGRGCQPHNYPQNHLQDLDLDLARQLVLDGDIETLELCFGSVSDTLSQLLRTAFIPSTGRILGIADFKAIEARIIAWQANERWRLDVFNTHGRIYEASASAMFKVPIELVTKGSVYRKKGKISELALGYQGGTGALRTMGAEKMGLTEKELPELVGRWRDANKNIVKLWYATNEAAITCIADKKPQTIAGCTYYMEKGILFCRLPSGRSLSYLKPILKTNQFGYPTLAYHGVNQKTRQWEEIPTYGGKLVENNVQAIARDCLAEKMLLLDDWNYDICLHVHDEPVVDLPEDKDFKMVMDIMNAPIEWAKGLPLGADGFTNKYYKKDD